MFMYITQIIAAIFCAALAAIAVNKINERIDACPLVETDEGPHLYISKEL